MWQVINLEAPPQVPKPHIFMLKPIIHEIEDGIKKIEEVINNIKIYNDINGIPAAYLYAYSIYEGSLYNLYRTFALAFPERIKFDFNYSKYKESLLNSATTDTLIEVLVNDFAKKFGHRNFEDLLTQLTPVLKISLKIDEFPHSIIDFYKGNRDCLAHRNCFKDKLSLKDIISHFNAIREVLLIIKNKLTYTYAKYTKEFLIREACSYLLGFNDFLFNKCFYFENDNFRVNVEEVKRYMGSASSSEKHIFILFIANFSTILIKENELIPTCSLDEDSKNKVVFINELFGKFPHLINS